MKPQSKEKRHKCNVCDKRFKTLASLRNHVNTHAGIRPHCCKECDATFTTSGELVRHVRYRHTHEKPHRCAQCDYASVELSKLKRHMLSHTGERPFHCSDCSYSSPDKYKLDRHIRTHTGEKPYKCDICEAQFTQSNSLKTHKLIHSGNKKIFQCDFCPTSCGRKTDLQIHVQKLHTSDKPLNCSRCGDPFPDRYSLKLHSKTHEGEKCFKCDLCSYASTSARHLESHMLRHTDQKPFHCEECDQAFRQKQLLRRHKNLYHNPDYVVPVPKEKTNKCSECDKCFRHKGNLERHLAIHDPKASVAEKNEALRIGEPKGPGEQSDGEEDDFEEEDDEDDSTQTFSAILTIAEQGAVQETKDRQQVVGFKEIEQQPQGAEPVPEPSQTDKMPNSPNGNSIKLRLQKNTCEEYCSYIVPEVIYEANPSPSLPSAAPPKRRGRPRKNTMVIQTTSPSLPLLKKIKVEEDSIEDEINSDVENDNKDKNVVAVYKVEEESVENEMESYVENDNDENVAAEYKGIKRLLQDFRQIFLDGRMSDLVLKVDSREFSVHKMVLVARSPVFSSLFENVLDKNTHIIDIPDCNPESFEVFLHYLYSGSLETLSASNVSDVYYAADKYHVDDLKEQCVRFMKINLSVETICDVISLSIIHEEESNLQKAANTFFCQNVKEIVKSVQWQKYLAENPIQAKELLNKTQKA